MSLPEPLELQLQREKLARIRIESQLEEAKLQIIQMELTLRQLRDLLAVPGLIVAQALPEAGPVSAVAPAPMPAKPTISTLSDARSSPAPSRRRPSPVRRTSTRLAAAPGAVLDHDPHLEEEPGEGGAATMTRISPPAILSTLSLHEGDNRELIREYISHARTRIEKMQSTLASMNMKELKWHAVWLKDNAAKVGFAQLVEPLTALEEAIQSENNALIGDRLDDFIQLADRIALEPPRR